MSDSIRRLVDALIAAVAIVVLAPVFVALGVAVRRSSTGPALHRAQRVGRHGRPFTLYKFRTMAVGGTGPAVTRAGDPRVTRVGALLRRTKLDELPQLWNVLVGDMALVGPRPEDARYVAMYDDTERHVLDVRPGMTGPASLRFSDEEAVLALAGGDLESAYLELMRAKLRIDLDYLARRTVRSDVGILLATLRAVAR